MELREIDSKEQWESLFGSVAEKTFLQSWSWGEYCQALGQKIWRFGVFENATLLSVAMAVNVPARRGAFLFVPHGPVMREDTPATDRQEIVLVLVNRLKDIAIQEKAVFIRMAPLLYRTEQNANLLDDLGFRQAPMHASAYEATWKLDITPGEDELLRQMRKTTRQLIKKEEENPDISIAFSADEKDLAEYQKLSQAVGQRQRFIPFSPQQIAAEFSAFSADGQVAVVLGKYRGEVVAGALVVFWSGVAFYHQAASVATYSKLSIPYLLQWECIKEAKRRGCLTYDFWGFTDPKQFPKHPWAGPTLFKMGFGGYPTEYLKTQDYAISSRYLATYLIESIRKFMRNL